MNRNPIFALGFGLLLGVGLLTPSCGGSEDLPKLDAGKDVGSTGGARTGGTTGAGGQTGAGGAMATGGATGAGGSILQDGGPTEAGAGGATGTGGATGAGGTTTVMDGGSDARLDVRRDLPRDQGADTRDVPVINPDGPTKLDTGALDTGIDSPPVTLDTAIDESAADAEAVDVEIDTSGLDTGID